MNEYAQILAQLAQNPGAMSFSDLRIARDRLPGRLDQELLAPLEHRAFAREWTRENPLNALALIAAIPFYQGAKGLGFMRGRSGASDPMGQMFAGYRGVAEGLGF